MSDKQFPTGDSQTFIRFKDMGDGTHAEVIYVVNPSGGGGGGGAAGVAGTPVVDNAGVRWLWVYDKDAGTSTYVSFATGATGTPTFPLTPDADTSVQVSNFPATQPVSGTVTANTGLTQPLTDTQLRAAAVPVSAATLPLPSGAATSALQTTGNTSLASIDADLGLTTDAAATSDTGTFSLIALVKRALTNWTTLLARIPALVGGRVPVDGSGVTQPVSASALPLPSGAATEATLSAASAKLPATLGQKVMAQSLAVSLASDQPAIDIGPAYKTSGKTAVTGAFSAIGNSAAFTPIAGRSFNVTRNGSGTATVRLTRSFDSGTTWLPLTANGVAIMTFTDVFSEQWSDDEVGVQYRLECTSYTSGTVTYRISQ